MCNDPQYPTRASVFAHELGHVYGLDDWGTKECSEDDISHGYGACTPISQTDYDFDMKRLLMYHTSQLYGAPSDTLFQNEAQAYE
jgi:hypothetical protein